MWESFASVGEDRSPDKHLYVVGGYGVQSIVAHKKILIVHISCLLSSPDDYGKDG